MSPEVIFSCLSSYFYSLYCIFGGFVTTKSVQIAKTFLHFNAVRIAAGFFYAVRILFNAVRIFLHAVRISAQCGAE